MQLNYDLVTRQELENEINKLKVLIESIKQDNISRPYLKGPEMQKMLGCSASTLRRMRISGKIEFKVIGKTIYYKTKDLG